MSDTPTAEPTNEPTAEAPAQEAGEQPKPDIDWKAKAREWEKRAKENKAAADRLAELEEANKSEAQKLADRLAAAEAAAEQATRDALRFKIATRYGVSDEDADLFLTASDEDTLTKQAERLAARNEEAGKPRAPKPDANQGRNSSGPASTADQFAAVFNGALNS